MLRSLHFVALAALATLPYGAVASSGSDLLQKCSRCEPIYKTMVKCQKIQRPGGIGDEIQNCICVPNTNPDGWYPYLDSCRDCLSSGGDSDFVDNLTYMITQLFTSCTERGGNVISDGASICASNAMWRMCASLQDGAADGALSWASFERFSDASQNTNATQLLYLSAAPQGTTADIGTSKTASAITTATAGTTGSLSSDTTTAPTSASSTSTLPSSTTSTQSSAPSSSSSAAAVSYGPRNGYALAAIGLAGLFL